GALIITQLLNGHAGFGGQSLRLKSKCQAAIMIALGLPLRGICGKSHGKTPCSPHSIRTGGQRFHRAECEGLRPASNPRRESRSGPKKGNWKNGGERGTLRDFRKHGAFSSLGSKANVYQAFLDFKCRVHWKK